MSKLETICEWGKITLIDEEQDREYSTTDQEKAISAFRSWICGGMLPLE